MLSKLMMKLDPGASNIGYNSGSLFQGVIMENIDSKYADKLHNLPYNPYSQYILKNNEELYWVICGVSYEAYENVILPLLELNTIEIKNKNIEIEMKDKKLETINRERFISEELFNSEVKSRASFHFVTPTAFKSNNKYVFIPTSRYIYQSLMNKFDSSGREEVFSIDILDELENKSYIAKYNLRSKAFNLEAIKIPSFVGELEIKFETTNEIKKLCNMLGKFAEYSGIGIKSAMGMGAVKYGEK